MSQIYYTFSGCFILISNQLNIHGAVTCNPAHHSRRHWSLDSRRPGHALAPEVVPPSAALTGHWPPPLVLHGLTHWILFLDLRSYCFWYLNHICLTLSSYLFLTLMCWFVVLVQGKKVCLGRKLGTYYDGGERKSPGFSYLSRLRLSWTKLFKTSVFLIYRAFRMCTQTSRDKGGQQQREMIHK